MQIDPDDFKQLVTLLGKLVQSIPQEKEESTSQDTQDDQEEDFSTKKKSVKKTKKSKNLFLEMPELSMHKQDSEIDKKLNKFPPTNRGRKYNPVQVKCRVCGRTENVSPNLVESSERYKCNSCSTSAG
jgi:lysyl-tRNA synthetase class I